MKKLCFLALVAVVVVVFNSVAQASQDVSIDATQGKACDWRTPDEAMGNTTQLMTRSAAAPDYKKSWLQFDLSSLYAADSSIKGNIIGAKLTLYGAKTETSNKEYVVSGLNNAANLEGWIASALTWNTGPGNNIASGNGLDATKTTSLYTGTVVFPCLDIMSETPEANRAALTSFLNTDTDGKITFIFTPGSTTYLWNAGQPLSPKLTLTYELGNNLEAAHYPNPADAEVVKTSLASLSWANPDPNGPTGIITCDVYLGTEPNRPSMNKKTLGVGVSTVAVNKTNFPTYGALADKTTYYWAVDVHDTTEPNVITGQMWSFSVNNNEPPVITMGDDQVVWGVPQTIALNTTVTDDGLPVGSTLSYTWTRTAGPATAVINSPNTEDTTVFIAERGDYNFMLTVTDGNRTSTATVRVVVGTNVCDASHISTGNPYDAGDQNHDCVVNLEDFAALIAANWMDCSDTLTDCGN
jgi:hypothetical protein